MSDRPGGAADHTPIRQIPCAEGNTLGNPLQIAGPIPGACSCTPVQSPSQSPAQGDPSQGTPAQGNPAQDGAVLISNAPDGTPLAPAGAPTMAPPGGPGSTGADAAPAPVEAPAAAPAAAPAPAADPAPAATPNALQGVAEAKGIDISKWQPNVDWGQVKADGIQIAFIKATEGKDYNDPSYASHRAGAAGQGIVSGAYDYARPGAANGDVAADAKAEAEHYLQVAGLKKGDVAPILDLEETGGLNKDQLAQWVKTWGDTVRGATGVQPILYTSPGFWNYKVANPEQIAPGFRLWVAHWGVNSPTVPTGFGDWQAWQPGGTTMPGIAGNVDQDRVRDPASLVMT